MGEYRYGFNGKENDNEVKGEGNQIDFGMRVYDSRVGRFLSIDPLFSDYPNQSVYIFAGNNSIALLDVEGAYPGEPTEPPTKAKLIVRRRVTTHNLTPHHTLSDVKFDRPTLKRMLRGIRDVGSTGAFWASLLKAGNSDYAGAGVSDGRETNFYSGYEVATTDPSLLEDDYLEEVRRRIIDGSASQQEQLYREELSKRGKMWGILSKEIPEFEKLTRENTSAINKAINRIVWGLESPEYEFGKIATIEDRGEMDWEKTWAGAVKYRVMIPGVKNTIRILQKKIGVDSGGNPIYRYGYTLDHYKIGKEPKIFLFKQIGVQDKSKRPKYKL